MSHRIIFTILAVFAARVVFADDIPFVWNSWFTEDYSGLNASTWADTAGTWTRSAQDQSSLEEENGQRYLQVGAGPNDLKFTAPTTSGAYKPVCVDSRMTFIACRNGEEYASAPTDSYAGLILRRTETENATNLVFAGWTARNWTDAPRPKTPRTSSSPAGRRATGRRSRRRTSRRWRRRTSTSASSSTSPCARTRCATA